MNEETKRDLSELEANVVSDTELESITAGFKVRSGVKAGLSPCI
jgi:hypothetical protein